MLVLVLLVLVALACSSPTSGAPATPPGGAPPPPLAESRATCSPARPAEAGTAELMLPAAGDAPATLVHVPPGYDGVTALPVLLNFHGGGGTPVRQNERSGLPATADEHGFLLVTPPVGPVEVFEAVLDAVIATWCVDPARVYSTGVSGGARHSSRLGCELSNRIAAIAPVSGVDFPPDGCPGARRVPVVAIHGTDDRFLPFDGAIAAVAGWAAHNGCDGSPVTEPLAPGLTLRRYEHCQDGADTRLYIVEGGTHGWLSSPERSDADAFDTNEVLWQFLSRYRLEP